MLLNLRHGSNHGYGEQAQAADFGHSGEEGPSLFSYVTRRRAGKRKGKKGVIRKSQEKGERGRGGI